MRAITFWVLVFVVILGLRIGTDHEYDSTLVGNNNDLRYSANLTYDF